jgi:hypothetical protein
MKRTNQQGILMLVVLAAAVAVAQTPTASIPVFVDCSSGQSVNRTLAKLDKHLPVTVTVNGTCTEYVQVIGFENLTLKGLPGAMLQEPATGTGNLFNSLLLIESSRSITVQGFGIQVNTSVPGIGIGHGSSDIRLRNLNVVGGGEGIIVFENSQVSLSHVNGRDAGYAPLGIYDSSDVHVEHCVFSDSTGAPWHAGIDLGASHVTLYDTTIKNMQVGINGGTHSIIDVQTFDTYTPFGGPSDVTILSPAGTNFNGVSLSGGASLNVFGARLVINNPGQPWGGTTGGVLVSDGSTLYSPSSNLVITGSHGQGVVVVNNSHATLVGSTVLGGGHGGLVVANLSSIDVSGGSNLTTQSLVGGNSVDLFCDAGSTITGSANLAGVPTAQCANLVAPDFVLP